MPKRKRKPRTPLTAIKAYCLECSGHSQENVDKCNLKDCELYAFRKGVDPYVVDKCLSTMDGL